VTQICGGHGHTVCLTAEGHVYTFGSSVFGQLGNGSNVKSSVPVHVTALIERITIIATNYFHNVSIEVISQRRFDRDSPVTITRDLGS
jgi:alpha-tubulin suppressor-like RCC1 family protein